MGFGKLRVLNDDVIEGGQGFGMHPHANMEIITLVTEGTLEHKDSQGNGGILKSGDVQVMSAGSGILHSEFNHAKDEPLALFQMWIETKEQNILPRYGQQSFLFPDNTLVAVASGLGDDGALYIHQNARVMVGKFVAGGQATLNVRKGNGIFAFVIEGTFTIAGELLIDRDALEISETEILSLKTKTGGTIILIEVPL
jgi:redox-sensitive bicupin YhaK (pirin superfamily)